MLLATRNRGKIHPWTLRAAERLSATILHYESRSFRQSANSARTREDGGGRTTLERPRFKLTWEHVAPRAEGRHRRTTRNLSEDDSPGALYMRSIDTRTLTSRPLRVHRRNQSPYSSFLKLLLKQSDRLRRELLQPEAEAQIASWGIVSPTELEKRLQAFDNDLVECIRSAEKGNVSAASNPLFFKLRRSFVEGNAKLFGGGNSKFLANILKYTFVSTVIDPGFTEHQRKSQEQIADLRYPLEWFPATRALQRTVHLHVGPTNSGKTFHALQRLEAAETGIYAGPLRLLAHEVYSRFNAKGKACALLTGEERRFPEGMNHVMNSCTVEMVPLTAKVDVAVIDEIQMMGDCDRGWAWTQAFLGVQAKEVHLCGELRTIDLVTRLCEAMGDKLVVHKYERLSPLQAETRSLNGDYSQLQKGDAIVAFSRVGIHVIKADVEKATGRRAAIIYGSLPPEIRAQQAALFNNPDNDYDFLVASDAIGMGLNLSIRRIIFQTTEKNDGVEFRDITISEIKQIAGRAGRFKSAQQAINEGVVDLEDGTIYENSARPPKSETKGFVTTLDNSDLSRVQRAMNTEAEPIHTAGIFPPTHVIEKFVTFFPPKTPLSYVISRLIDLASMGPLFHMCRAKEQLLIADAIEPFTLTLADRLRFLNAPLAMRDKTMQSAIKEFAKAVAENENGHLLSIKTLNLDLLDQEPDDYPSGPKAYLTAVESLHRAITAYLWLSYRYAGVFISQALAFHVKDLVEARINQLLEETQGETAAKKKARTRLRKMAQIDMAKKVDDMRTVLAGAPDIEIEGTSTESEGEEEVITKEDDKAEPVAKDLEDNDMLDERTSQVDSESFDIEDSPAADANIPTLPSETESKSQHTV